MLHVLTCNYESKWMGEEVSKGIGQIIGIAFTQLPMPCMSDTCGEPVKNPDSTEIY